MTFLYSLLVLLHILGTAALIGGWLATFRTPTVGFWQHVGAWVQLGTGLLLVGLLEMDDAEVNHVKIGIKLVVLVGVLVAAVLGRRAVRRGAPVSVGVAHAVGGLAVVNAAIAVLW